MNNNDQNNQNYQQYYNQNYQQTPQPMPYQGINQNPNMTSGNVLDKEDKKKLIIAGSFLVAGWFVAGLICGIVSVCIAQSVTKKNVVKTIISILGSIEIIIMILYTILNLMGII